MTFIVTPGSLQRQSELYYQLASLTTVGIGLPRALEQLGRRAPDRSFRRSVGRTIEQIEQGNTFVGALKETGNSLPAFDLALLQAGEQSGRLDACFRLLSDYYRERAQIAKRVIVGLLYPVLLLHFVLLIMPIGLLQGLVWQGEVLPFLLQKLMVLGPIYALVLLFLFAAQGRHGEWWRSIVEAVIHRIPGIGTARRQTALSRLAIALEALINAGVPIVRAWELAAAASGSPALRRSVRAWKPKLEAGQTPAQAMSESPAFPDTFANLYATGEATGRIDDTLQRLHHYYQEEATRKLRAFSIWFPLLIYLGIVLLVAYQVIKFWTGYFGRLNEF